MIHSKAVSSVGTNLWGYILRCTAKRVGHSICEYFRKPEINNDGISILVHHNVLKFEIAEDYLSPMDVVL
jgi:hypothetical protein